MSSNVYNFCDVRELIGQKEFEKAYQLLKTIGDKCAEWYYLNGISAMNIGYYEEGALPAPSGFCQIISSINSTPSSAKIL